MKTMDLHTLQKIKDAALAKLDAAEVRILVCGGAGCVSSNCAAVRTAAQETLAELGLADRSLVLETGCMGICAMGPMLVVQPQDILYTQLTPETTRKVLRALLAEGRVLEEHTFFDRTLRRRIPKLADIPFFNLQERIVLRNCGRMDYSSIDAYIARDGYFAAAKALLAGDGRAVVDTIKQSGLAGRGGAGFPTGIKWEAGRTAQSDTKYLVCNADEGDPGAFMDRSILEGDPHSPIEGMILGGFAIGAHQGFMYVRAEYPLAIQRLEEALGQAREYGMLGRNIFGSGFDFDIEIRIGAGAFVCGEETSLMNSVEGGRGEPRQKPPYPFQSGIFGKPTIINNVETFANVPAILQRGAEWFAGIGSEKTHGTKVFALAGDIANTGIVEVPFGMSLGTLLFDIGGGIHGRKQFKAAQIGGPSGGCITREQLNTPIDYQDLEALGAIMGSGGLIVMNEDGCMVDTARYFMDFIQDESCGKCTACRLGTKRMLEILERITRGEGEEEDIALLEELSHTIRDTAVCGLGQTSPNPVLSALENFHDEFVEHIRYGRCRAGVCADLFVSPCENTCPANVNVPGYTALIAEGRFVDAYKLIWQENPFPAVCGRICTRPCEAKCRRRSLDEAVAICDLKRFVSDYAYAHELPYGEDIIFPKNGKSVAVVGAGASGLTCGHYLARLGYDVDVYERENVPGGVLAFGIPEYRLPNDVLMHEISLVEKEGVRIHLSTEVGNDISFDQLRGASDAVFVAIGTQYPQRIDIPGEELAGVVHGIDFLKNANLARPMEMGKRVLVVGGGNTAIDSARTALRMGAESVKLLYRRSRSMMPAYESEVAEALEEGVELVPMTQPLRMLGDEGGRVRGVECQKMVFGEFDSSGRRRSVAGQDPPFVIECDMVIPAISQVADLPFIPADQIGRAPWGTFTVDPDTMMTSMDGVFAGGDIVHGPDSVIQAIADGKKAAAAIDRYLGGRGVLNKGVPIEFAPVVDDDEVVELGRYPLDMLSMEQRKNNFDEVVLGYHKLTAIAEAMRCLHCERRA